MYEHGDADSDGIVLTSQAFATVASWFPYVLTVAVILFAFSTVLSYYYYGQLAVTFIVGNRAWVVRAFQVVWILAVVVGSAISLESVISFSDSLFFLMTVPNLLGIYLLSKVLRLEILRHRVKVTTGAIEQVDPELAVGMGDHDPSQEQIAAAAAEEDREQQMLDAVQERLAADPDYPSTQAQERD